MLSGNLSLWMSYYVVYDRKDRLCMPVVLALALEYKYPGLMTGVRSS